MAFPCTAERRSERAHKPRSAAEVRCRSAERSPGSARGGQRCHVAHARTRAVAAYGGPRESADHWPDVAAIGPHPEKKSVYAPQRRSLAVVLSRSQCRGRIARVDPTRLVFAAEFGIDLAMTPLYGRAPRGERAVGYSPLRGLHFNLVFGLALRGIVAPLLYGGTTTAAFFTAYTRQCLVPALKPDELVVLDHHAAHSPASAAIPLGEPPPLAGRHPKFDSSGGQ